MLSNTEMKETIDGYINKMKYEYKTLNDKLHMVMDSIAIGTNTPIKDLNATPVTIKGEKV